jgi:dTDP-4-dehydrorhamnose reductase
MSAFIVPGGDGQLGSCLREISPKFEYLSQSDLDITDKEAVEKKLKNKSVINLAAYTAVDKAEEDKKSASAVNALAVGHISRVAKRLIHISTDYVFDGHKPTAYLETDPTQPLNHYGASKRAGELMALGGAAEAFVIRSSWLYSHHKINFVKRMIELSQTKDELRIVSDQMGCPTSGIDLAQLIFKISHNWESLLPGLYHFANEGECSWYDLAKRTLELKGIKTPVIPITTQEYPTPARRPLRSSLNCSKIKAALNIKIQSWPEALKEVVQRL